MIVEYPDRKRHKIDVSVVEEIEKDGSYLIHGNENGRSVILHLKKEGDRFFKIPENSMEYVRLSLPFVKKRNVTSIVKPILDSSEIITSTRYNDTYLEEERTIAAPEKQEERPRFATAPLKMIKVFIDEKGSKFITRSAAYELGFDSELTKERFHEILNSAASFILSSPSYHLSDPEFEFIKNNFGIEYVNLRSPKVVEKREIEPRTRTTTFQVGTTKAEPLKFEKKEEKIESSYMEQQVANSFRMVKETLQTNENRHAGLQSILLFLVRRNREIMKLEPGYARDGLLLILYHDLADIKEFASGRFEPNKIISNLSSKIDAFRDFFYHEKINDNVIASMLYKLLEMLQNKYDRTGSITFDDIFEIELFIDGIVSIITSYRKEEREEKINRYLVNNIHYERAVNKLNQHTK